MNESSEVVSLLLREYEDSDADWLFQLDKNRRLCSVSPRLAFALGRELTEMVWLRHRVDSDELAPISGPTRRGSMYGTVAAIRSGGSFGTSFSALSSSMRLATPLPCAARSIAERA